MESFNYTRNYASMHHAAVQISRVSISIISSFQKNSDKPLHSQEIQDPRKLETPGTNQVPAILRDLSASTSGSLMLHRAAVGRGGGMSHDNMVL